VAFGAEAIGHHPLGFAAIELHLEACPGREFLQRQAGADVIERAWGAAQIEGGHRI
jgi:hypothetical protein